MRLRRDPHLTRQHRTQLLQSVALFPGTGKSRTAAAVARDYRDLGLLPLGHAAEVAAADLADTKPWEAARLVGEAARLVPGGVLMITDAHAWNDLPHRGQQMLRCLYRC